MQQASCASPLDSSHDLFAESSYHLATERIADQKRCSRLRKRRASRPTSFRSHTSLAALVLPHPDFASLNLFQPAAALNLFQPTLHHPPSIFSSPQPLARPHTLNQTSFASACGGH
eukprot:2695884-Rhodomonas_salina.2